MGEARIHDWHVSRPISWYLRTCPLWNRLRRRFSYNCDRRCISDISYIFVSMQIYTVLAPYSGKNHLPKIHCWEYLCSWYGISLQLNPRLSLTKVWYACMKNVNNIPLSVHTSNCCLKGHFEKSPADNCIKWLSTKSHYTCNYRVSYLKFVFWERKNFLLPFPHRRMWSKSLPLHLSCHSWCHHTWYLSEMMRLGWVGQVIIRHESGHFIVIRRPVYLKHCTFVSLCWNLRVTLKIILPCNSVHHTDSDELHLFLPIRNVSSFSIWISRQGAWPHVLFSILACMQFVTV